MLQRLDSSTSSIEGSSSMPPTPIPSKQKLQTLVESPGPPASASSMAGNAQPQSPTPASASSMAGNAQLPSPTPPSASSIAENTQLQSPHVDQQKDRLDFLE